MLVVIEGIDGSGKTTIANKLVNRSTDYYYCSRKTILEEDGFIKEQMKKVSSLMWTDNNGEFDHFLPVDYWINLQLTWYSLLQEFIIKPNLNKLIIVDGWYYKFWARLEAQNIDIDYLKVAFKRIIKPDHVFLLSTDVKKIIDRKNDIKKYEQGSHIGLQGNEGFVAFQNITAKNLRKYAEAYNWTVINNNDDIINTVNAIDEMIKQELLIGDE